MARWRHVDSGRREVVGRQGPPSTERLPAGLPWRLGRPGLPREALAQVRGDPQVQDPRGTPERDRKGEGTGGELGTGGGPAGQS